MKLELISMDRQEPPIVLTQFPVIVGLDPGSDICLDDSAVGHYQCMIDACDGLLMVWDLGTKLGTAINGARISPKAALMPGDELRIGRSCYVAHYGDEAHRRSSHPGHHGAGSHRSSAVHRAHQPLAPV
jgi:hypothetical protein